MGPTTVSGSYFYALGRHNNEQIEFWQRKLAMDEKALDTAHRMSIFALEELLVELGMRRAKSSEMAKMHRRLRALGFDFSVLDVQRVWDADVHHEGKDSRVRAGRPNWSAPR